MQDTIKIFKKSATILVAYPAKVFSPIVEVAELYTKSLLDSGVIVSCKPVVDLVELNAISKKGEYTHILVLNPHNFSDPKKGFILNHYKHTKVFAFSLEQTPIEGQISQWASMRLSQIAFFGSFFDGVIVESKNKMLALKNLGLRVLYFNIPYHPAFDPNYTPSLEEKTYDVFFVGADNKRRLNLIEDLKKEKISVAPAVFPKSLDRKYKEELIRKSKICLNVHFSDMEYFEKPRLFYDYFINKGVVVTEKIADLEHFQHVQHLFMSTYQNLVATTAILLKKYNKDAMSLGVSAYEQFKQQYAFEGVVNNFLQELIRFEVKI